MSPFFTIFLLYADFWSCDFEFGAGRSDQMHVYEPWEELAELLQRAGEESHQEKAPILIDLPWMELCKPGITSGRLEMVPKIK
jgi:hypothetical protein